MKHIKSFFIVFIALSLTVSISNAQTMDTPETAPLTNSSSSEADIQYNTLYASAYDQLWLIDADTGQATYVGNVGRTVTDVAFHLGNLYGITFSQLIQIDPTTGAGTVIGSMGYSDVNGLTISRDGTGYATTISGKLLRVNITTGQATFIGNMGDGYHSAGDVAISDDDRIYAAVFRDGYAHSWLVYIDRETGAATPINDIGYNDVWGISFKDGILYGVTLGGEILSIDTNTGIGTLINTSTTDFYGLATSGPSIIGSIISPPDNYTTGPATVLIEATAEYPGGPGIAQVEFYAYSDTEWRSYGDDETAPYSVAWTPPVELVTQQLLLRIDVVGLDLERVNYAGGVRRLNYIQSLGNPNIIENWVGNRAYLSQRSLGANGDSMCSATSMAMVLAMEGLIDNDYQTMAEKAIEMYPRVLFDDTAYVYLIERELINQGADAVYFGEIDNDEGWSLLKAYIDAGHSMILRSEHNVLTNYGHYIVAVGYQETGNTRTVIVYDPFGMWRGLTCGELGTRSCSGNYYTNQQHDPTSHVGQWVFYDFNRIFGNYIIAPVSPMSLPRAEIILTTAPDLISDEPRIIGTNPGIEYGEFTYIYLPLLDH